MATVIGTYTYDWMRAIPGGFGTADVTNRGILWNFVHQLTGQLQGGSVPGAWTVELSSDGSGYGATNRWWNGGVFNAALMPWTNDGFPHSWIVLKSPSALTPQMWICITLNTYPGSGSVWQVTMLASFTAFTGGSTTARPTSPTEFSFGSGCNSTWTTTWNMCNTALNHKTHLSLASDGAFFWGANSAGDTFKLALAVAKLLDPPTVDNFPVAVFRTNHTDQMQFGSHNVFPAKNGAIDAGSYSAWWPNFLEQDTGSGAVINPGHSWSGRNFDNTQTVRMKPWFPVIRGNDGDYVKLAPWALDQIRQQYPEWQVWLCAVQAGGSGNLGNKGRVRDLHTAFGMAELLCEPSGADPITRVVWGQFWLPGNQVLAF